MKEQKRYNTKQQNYILECVKREKEVFRTAEEIRRILEKEGIQVGQATVYRGLERLTRDGLTVKIPSVDGAKAQYRYIGEETEKKKGKLICIRCGNTIPLECSRMEKFFEHIEQEHHFQLDIHRTVLYGYCSACRKDVSVSGEQT